MRGRPSTSIVLALLSASAVLVSVLTPMLLRGTQSVVLARGVQDAPYLGSHIVGTGQSSDGDPVAIGFRAVRQISGAARTAGLWTAARTAAESLDAYPWQRSGGAATAGYLGLVEHGCDGLVLVSGRCPRHVPIPKPSLRLPIPPPEVLLPASVLHGAAAPTESIVTLDPGLPIAMTLTVVGVYDDSGGVGLLVARPDRLDGQADARPVAALLLAVDDAARVTEEWNFWSARRLRGPVRLAEVAAVGRDVARARIATAGTASAAVGGRLETAVPALLAHIAAGQAAALVLTSAVALQALALAWFTLATVIGRVSRSRAAEWGIGRTRGVPLATWLALVFVEPLVAVVIGALLGYGLGVLAASAIVRIGLGPSVAVEPFQPPVLIAAAVATAGSLLSIAAASLRSARLPLPMLLRETTEPRQLTRIALVAQVGVVLVAVTVLWAVLTQARHGLVPVGLLLPALVATVVALGALQLAVVLVRRSTERPARSLRGLVIGRQLARSPSALSTAVLVTIGFALAAYTLQLALVADRAAINQAQVAVGADSVLQVSGPAGADLESVVRRADPSGREAMAAEESNGPGQTGVDHVVAVDMSRLAAVSAWRAQWRGTDWAASRRRLDPSTSGDLVVRGARLTLTISDLAAGQAENLPPSTTPQIQLSAVVATPTRWVTLPFGALRNGALTSATSMPCEGGCRLVSINIARSGQQPPQPYGASFDLTGISTDQQPASSFRTFTGIAARWRERIAATTDPSFPVTALPRQDDSRVEFVMDDRGGDGSPAIEPNVGSATLPALVTAGTDRESFSGLTGVVFGPTSPARRCCCT